MVGLRWAFQCGCWKPTAHEWALMMAAVQSEERERINRFVFQRDAKAALAGRLLMRKAICHLTGLSYSDIKLDRTEKGKPFLINALPDGLQFDFNVSHDGDYAVLAAETSHLVGVDTVQLDRTPGSKSAEQFFTTMSRQLTAQEWRCVRSKVNEQAQLAAFYRYWCLKESYVKALGVGVGLSLDRLCCRVVSPVPVTASTVINDTKILLDGQEDDTTNFEESILNDKHMVAVSLKQVSTDSLPASDRSAVFSILTVGELIAGLEQLTDTDDEIWNDFCLKPEKPSMTRT